MALTDEEIALIREQTLELKRKSDLDEAALKLAQEIERDRKVSERNRIKIALDTNEKVGALVEQLPQALLAVYGLREVITEGFEEVTREIRRLNEIALIQLTGKGNGNRARVEELKAELQTEHDQRLLDTETQNLQELREQRAQYGLNPPLNLVNEIKRAEKAIEKLEAKLNELT